MSSAATEQDFLGSKLRPPWSRNGLVARSSLVDQLLSAEAPIIAVVAPPGYGKTTLLSQLQQRNPLPGAWLSLDALDNDPAVLLAYLASALQQIPIGSNASLGSLTSPRPADLGSLLRRLAVVVSSIDTPFSLVLDHVEAIDTQPSCDTIAELAFNLPPGARLALASRRELPLPMARLRARGSVVDVGIDDLAMSDREAGALLQAAGVQLDHDHLEELVIRTEGWPAGLYLAALAIKTGADRSAVVSSFDGHDRFVAEYLRSEVMASLATSTASFLTKTAVLDRLHGPLCDAVTGTPGSQQLLESLAASNLFVIPLDRRGAWYRCHHLFRELLQTELSRSEPKLVPGLHDRAADWFEAHGHEDFAVGHAQAAGDADRAARLVSSIGHPMLTAGRVETLLRWLQWFDAHGLIDRHPHLAVLGALAESVEGHPRNAERWAHAARSGTADGVLADGSTAASWIAVLDAYMCRRGPEQIRADAELALAQLAPGSPWRSSAVFFDAMSYFLQGDAETADDRLADAVEVSLRAGAMPIAARAFAERAALAIGRHEWSAADACAREAMAVVEAEHIETFLDSTVVLAVSARTKAHFGELEQAKQMLVLASRLRPKCTDFFPISAQYLIELAHAYLEVADAAGCTSRPATGARHPRRSPATRCRCHAGRPAPTDSRDDPRRDVRNVDAHRSGATAPAAARHPPVVGGDRGAVVRVEEHREVPGDLHLPQARCVGTQPGHPSRRGGRPAQSMITCEIAARGRRGLRRRGAPTDPRWRT